MSGASWLLNGCYPIIDPDKDTANGTIKTCQSLGLQLPPEKEVGVGFGGLTIYVDVANCKHVPNIFGLADTSRCAFLRTFSRTARMALSLCVPLSLVDRPITSPKPPNMKHRP